tara:strand:- start:56 stop:799 length:744 start_codon:yes stop_codon:yes gene_type:complete
MTTNTNSTDTKALLQRRALQSKQSVDLNTWIFDQFKFNPEAVVLELCCGVGTQTRAFLDQLGSGTITAVDINSESLDHASKEIVDDRVNFVASDIDDVDNYLNQKFDVIFCSYGFYYSKDSDRLFKHLRDYLREEGKFILVGPVKGNNEQIFRVVREIGCAIADSVLYSSEQFMLDHLTAFLSSFSKIKFCRITNDVCYEEPQLLLEYWRNTTFYTPQHDKEFLEACDGLFPEGLSVTKSIGYLEGS